MKRYAIILGWLTSLIIPFLLLTTVIRLLFNPFFVQLEYQRPGFPVDLYGFSTADRLKWAGVSLEYMHNSEAISFLENQVLDDGSPLYNQRELSHMLDVKIVFQNMVRAWYLLLAVLVALQLIAWRAGWLQTFWHAIARGGWLTIGFILAIILAVGISFNWLFTMFHKLFFAGDSWIFSYSDSLIRLFPLQLWQDAFLAMGIITLIAAVLLWMAGNRLSLRFR